MSNRGDPVFLGPEHGFSISLHRWSIEDWLNQMRMYPKWIENDLEYPNARSALEIYNSQLYQALKEK